MWVNDCVDTLFFLFLTYGLRALSGDVRNLNVAMASIKIRGVNINAQEQLPLSELLILFACNLFVLQ